MKNMKKLSLLLLLSVGGAQQVFASSNSNNNDAMRKARVERFDPETKAQLELDSYSREGVSDDDYNDAYNSDNEDITIIALPNEQVLTLATQFKNKMQKVLGMVQGQSQSYFSSISNGANHLYNQVSAAAASTFSAARSSVFGSAQNNANEVVVNDQTENSAVDENGVPNTKILYTITSDGNYKVLDINSNLNSAIITTDRGTQWAKGVIRRRSQETPTNTPDQKTMNNLIENALTIDAAYTIDKGILVPKSQPQSSATSLLQNIQQRHNLKPASERKLPKIAPKNVNPLVAPLNQRRSSLTGNNGANDATDSDEDNNDWD